MRQGRRAAGLRAAALGDALGPSGSVVLPAPGLVLLLPSVGATPRGVPSPSQHGTRWPRDLAHLLRSVPLREDAHSSHSQCRVVVGTRMHF